MIASYLAVGFALGLTSGVWLGRWARDQYWRGAARIGVRACSDGRLFRVTEEP